MHTSPDLIYQLALTCVPQIGPVQARILLEHYQTAEDIFRSKVSLLEKLDGIGTVRARSIKQFKQFQEQEKAIRELSKYHIRTLFIKDPDYPRRLLHCYDPPTLLFFKGSADLNTSRILSFIGTRSNTDYGHMITEQLLEELSSYSPLIVSGLAYGIDAIAHRKSLQLEVPTLGVLGHGLDTIYPSAHYGLAHEMVEKGGGLLSEFRCKTLPDRHHFPSRNRIVAGISDATVVIETATRGGSMITATLACDYNRDVFAVPGKINEQKSAGCNQLIAQQKAQLIQSGKEVADILGWTKKEIPRSIAKQLFIELTNDEKEMLTIFDGHPNLHIDHIHASSLKSTSHVASLLLNLEIKGMIRCLPGKIYQLIQ
jgi:DNA processing protein